jgi:hypothetical protein
VLFLVDRKTIEFNQKSSVVAAKHGAGRRAFNWIVKSPPIEGRDLTAIPLRVASLNPESHAKNDE